MMLQSDKILQERSFFRIIDLSGRVLHEQIITEDINIIQVRTSGLKNGIYLYAVFFYDGNLVYIDKLVIIR